MTLSVGELCAGVGALGLALTDVLDCAVVWHAQFEPPDKRGRPDRNQYAARVLARRFPDTPNHGDITAIDYNTVQPVDIVAAGFPCQDISLAGRRVGMLEGTRSGVWRHVARAIGQLRPDLVFLENVRSLTSARADGHVEPCPWCLGETGGGAAVRALGVVLGDLAHLGFDAEWEVVRASDVGAPHRRERVFVLAWPAADPAHHGLQRAGKARGGGS